MNWLRASATALTQHHGSYKRNEKGFFMRHTLLTFIFSASIALPAFGDAYNALSKYSSGDSLAWFYEIREKTQNLEQAENISEKLCEIVANKKLSDEAFRLVCDLLKPIDDGDCVEILAPFLLDETRCPYVCDVFVVLQDSAVDGALRSALANPEASQLCKKNIISAMASRGKDKSAVIEVAKSDDKKLSLYATEALARFSDASGLFSIFDTSVVSALNDILSKNDYRKQAAEDALVMIADKAVMAGNVDLASDALENVSSKRADAVLARSKLMNSKSVAYLDSIVTDKDLAKSAGRAMNGLRTFENSSEIIKKFPTLSRETKLAIMGNFMISGDTRFYPVIAKELDSKDADIRALAVYSARFLCSDEPNLIKIYNIYKSGEAPIANYAENVLVENSSYAVQRVLKQNADAGDMAALEILIRRGDEQYRMKLWNMFFDVKMRTPAVCRMMERTITSGEVNLLATNFKVKDEVLSKEIAKIIVKKMMQYRISREYIAKAVKVALDGNLSKDDPNYKFIVSRLKIEDLVK